MCVYTYIHTHSHTRTFLAHSARVGARTRKKFFVPVRLLTTLTTKLNDLHMDSAFIIYTQTHTHTGRDPNVSIKGLDDHTSLREYNHGDSSRSRAVSIVSRGHTPQLLEQAGLQNALFYLAPAVWMLYDILAWPMANLACLVVVLLPVRPAQTVSVAGRT
jgi:hypothetical protein